MAGFTEVATNCLHCKNKVQSKSKYCKNLCRKCYDKKQIRNLYPSLKKKPESKVRCLNCQVFAGIRSRGLCKACYENKEIWMKFAPKTNRESGYAFIKVNDIDFHTSNPPGSEEKMRILQHRASQNMNLFSPLDKKMDLS